VNFPQLLTLQAVKFIVEPMAIKTDKLGPETLHCLTCALFQRVYKMLLRLTHYFFTLFHAVNFPPCRL
jgi:hypothetical protein